MNVSKLHGLALIAACLVPAGALGNCRVEDDAFTTADGGCKDLSTGLVFSADLGVIGGGPHHPGPTNNLDGDCFYDLSMANHGGFSDWRTPTLGEYEEALANGLASHNDYFLNGSGPVVDDPYMTACEKKVRGQTKNYTIDHLTGAVDLSFAGRMLCVRGLPRPSDCFGPAGGDSGPGNGKGGGNGNGKNKTSLLLPRASTGGILLLPLCLVATVCCMRRPWA